MANFPCTSVTLIQKYLATTALGVPPIAPVVELSVRPVGRDPSVRENLYGAVPPVATITPEYGTPTTPVGREGVSVKDQDGTAWPLPANKMGITAKSATEAAHPLACLKT